MQSEILQDIKRGLRHSWFPFFGRFGTLTPVQMATIPKLLEGKNVIVSSPAASGKTEAVLAPLVERILGKKGLNLLYIAPTRALVNDLFHRLKETLMACNLKGIARTGDRPNMPSVLPNVLFTTPESFDSLLCRYPKIWSDLRAVVLDEIHLIDNTYRGDQMRVLIKRLTSEYARGPIFAALSATLSRPRAVGQRYFDVQAVINIGVPRRVNLYLMKDWREIIQFLRKRRWHKVIVFCNARKDVERLYPEISRFWPKERILLHHGSLSKVVREQTERWLREWSWGICISTMTLEVGIDIGDFDAAILYHPPPTPSSFQQRIGRACREDEDFEVIGYYENDAERQCFEFYKELANEGLVEEIEYNPDLSVAVQQIFSLLYAHPGGVDEEKMIDILGPICQEETANEIISYLLEKGWLAVRHSRIFATEKLMNLGERGLIHSNIPTFGHFQVIEFNTGRTIGEVFTSANEGDVFVLAGRPWQIVSIKKRRLYVRLLSTFPEKVYFKKRPSKGAFTHYLPEHLR